MERATHSLKETDYTADEEEKGRGIVQWMHTAKWQILSVERNKRHGKKNIRLRIE